MFYNRKHLYKISGEFLDIHGWLLTGIHMDSYKISYNLILGTHFHSGTLVKSWNPKETEQNLNPLDT